MSKMSRDLLDSMGRFMLEQTEAVASYREREEKTSAKGGARKTAAAGAH
jgi:hypothetical protein